MDLLFAPPVEEVYPEGFETAVRSAGSRRRSRATRPSAGRSTSQGVTTVVTKLFNMAGPDVAYFGQKDAQQALVIRKLVRDLDIPVRIEVCPTIRDPDGLALSSRNAYLCPEERERALALNRALHAAAGAPWRAACSTPPRSWPPPATELDAPASSRSTSQLRSATDLSPVERVNGSTLLAVAARVGRARLIDNAILGGEQ